MNLFRKFKHYITRVILWISRPVVGKIRGIIHNELSTTDKLLDKIIFSQQKLDQLLITCEKIEKMTDIQQKIDEILKDIGTNNNELLNRIIDINSTQCLLKNNIAILLRFSVLNSISPNIINSLNTDREIPAGAISDLSRFFWHDPNNLSLVDIYNSIKQELLWNVHSLSPEFGVAAFKSMLQVPGNNINYILSSFIHYLDLYVRDAEQILELSKSFECCQNVWEEHFKKTWIVYIHCLVDSGHVGKALEVAREYERHFSLDGLESRLPVAHFLHQQGITNKYIEIAYNICATIQKNIQGNIFAKMLAGKRVAIVGNGPFELGKGKGKEIDGYDIVFRFGYLREGFSEDYGSKTTFCVKQDFEHDEITNPVCCAPENLFLHHYLEWHSPHSLEFLSQYASIPGKNIFVLPLDAVSKTITASGHICPTAGAKIVDYVKMIHNSIKIYDIYGFSFIQPNYIQYTHFDNNDASSYKIMRHNLELERPYLQRLFLSDNESTSDLSHLK